MNFLVKQLGVLSWLRTYRSTLVGCSIVALTICVWNVTLPYQVYFQWSLAALALFWHYVVIAVLFSLMWFAVVFRRFAACTALAGAILLGVAGIPIGDFASNLGRPADDFSMKVVTFNWLGGNRDRSEIFDWIATEKPDVLSIQEFHSDWAIKKIRRTLPFVTESDGDVIIFSRFPLVRERETSIHYRPIVAADAVTPVGTISLYGVHAPTLIDVPGVLRRNVYLDALSDFIEPNDGRLVIMGDFNASRWDTFTARVKQKNRLHETPTVFPSITRLLGKTAGIEIGSPIDHLMVGESMLVSDCKVGPQLGSDHKPLICTVSKKR